MRAAALRRYLPGLRTIRGKLVVSLLAISFLGTAATLIAIFALWRVEDKIRLIESFYEINEKILETRRHEKNYLLFGNPRDLMNALDFLDEIRSSLAASDGFLSSVFLYTRPNYDREIAAYGDLLQRLARERLSPGELAELKEEVRQRGHAITRLVLDTDETARRSMERRARNYQRLAILMLGVTALVGTAVIVLMVSWIMTPLDAIRTAAAGVRDGQTSTIPITPAISGSVEARELVDSLNVMLSSLEEKQEELLLATKLATIGKVTAGIAHELNNPLNNISLTAEVLLDDPDNYGCEEWLSMVNDILVQTERAREVVRHLLDFARARKPGAWEEVDLVDLARSSHDLVRNQLRIGGVTATLDLPEEPIVIRGNPNQLQQVLINIVLNGMQAAGEGGEIAVSAGVEEGGKRGVITVCDSGPGIDGGTLAHIFDPFFTTKDEGTGLGLSVSHAIVREHGGDIQVRSGPTSGTVFRILLPLAAGEG